MNSSIPEIPLFGFGSFPALTHRLSVLRLDSPPAGELSSAEMREQVVRARAIQRRRFANDGSAAGAAGAPGAASPAPGSRLPVPASSTTTNATMTSRHVRCYCRLDKAGELLLKQAMTELGLSPRAHDKVLRIARTIADIEGVEAIRPHHLAEAIQYHRLDRAL